MAKNPQDFFCRFWISRQKDKSAFPSFWILLRCVSTLYNCILAGKLLQILFYMFLNPRQKMLDRGINARFVKVGTTITATHNTNQKSSFGFTFTSKINPKRTTGIALKLHLHIFWEKKTGTKIRQMSSTKIWPIFPVFFFFFDWWSWNRKWHTWHESWPPMIHLSSDISGLVIIAEKCSFPSAFAECTL